MWKQYVNALLGLATIVVPFLGLSSAAFMWTLVVMGAVVLILSLWTVGEVPGEEYERIAHHSHA